ncbi:hypothetical protein SPSYN_00722 [Sporotomaculum syntrophicum]|uniref:Uncharacterized protein n=1 Tax=Sporotomaculum syntrophicum TaxID=182264 RepID=A0A9D2WRE1_9FIRM|nr:hypothetical protein [Sporotomaculum syntrophicum]KAF1085984.1 hypothetical protein SPSYN_00722 [Sporotomaculum syntrophicum]
MVRSINVDEFVKIRQNDITQMVNIALNRAGEIIQQKVANGEIKATMQDVLPVLLYEVLITNTVATLRLVAEMINSDYDKNNGGMDH